MNDYEQRLLKNAELRANNYEDQLRNLELADSKIQDVLTGIEWFHRLSWYRRVWLVLKKESPLDKYNIRKTIRRTI